MAGRNGPSVSMVYNVFNYADAEARPGRPSRMPELMPFEAELRIDPRALRLGVRVHPGGKAVVTVPKGCSYTTVLRFMRRHKDWVEEAAVRMRRFAPAPTRAEARRAYLLHKEAARRFAYAAVARFAPGY